MDDGISNDRKEALRVIATMISKSENAQKKFVQGTSQHTLLKNRIRALYIASSLITKELAEKDGTACFAREDLEEALEPIASLISKSKKAQKKLEEGTWQHTMLNENIKALYIASPLLANALAELDSENEQIVHGVE